jgi:membrane fusion protein (multidrug efflux system)
VQKKVMVAQAIGDKVIVKSGLESGERVVVDGVQKLHDGSILTLGGPAGAKPAGK